MSKGDSWPSLPRHCKLRDLMVDHRLNHGRRPYRASNYPDFSRMHRFLLEPRRAEHHEYDEPFEMEDAPSEPFPVLELPIGLLASILGVYFTPVERLECRLVCKQFKLAAEQYAHWKRDIQTLWCGGSFIGQEMVQAYAARNQEFRVYVAALCLGVDEASYCDRVIMRVLDDYEFNRRTQPALDPRVSYGLWRLLVVFVCHRFYYVHVVQGGEALETCAPVLADYCRRAYAEPQEFETGRLLVAFYLEAVGGEPPTYLCTVDFDIATRRYQHMRPARFPAETPGADMLRAYRMCVSDPVLVNGPMMEMPLHTEPERWYGPARRKKRELDELAAAVAAVYDEDSE